MNKTLTVLCAALVLSAPLAGFAQSGPPQGNDGGPSNQGRAQQGQQQGKQQGQQQGQQQGKQQGSPQQQGNSGNNHSQSYRNPGFRPQAGMPVPHQQWQRGRVVEPNYRSDRYWVIDWKERHLYAPPRDHRWLYINGDYVLMAITTGVIANILAGY